MTDTAVDRPDIIVFPPVIPLSTLAISCVLQWLVPLGLEYAQFDVWPIDYRFQFERATLGRFDRMQSTTWAIAFPRPTGMMHQAE